MRMQLSRGNYIEAKNKRQGSNGGSISERESSLVYINFGEGLMFIEAMAMRGEADT